MLTGNGIQVGSASQFGIGFGGPAGMASDGTTVFMFHLRRGYTLDPVTGIATQFGGNNLGLSFNPRLSAAMFHNGLITVHGTQNDQLYTLDTTNNTLTAIGATFTIAGSGSSPVVTGITSLNGIVYAAEAFTDALMTLDIPSGVLTPVDGNTVGYGLDSPNIQSLTAYKEMLVAVNIDATPADIRLVELSTTDGAATAFNTVTPPDNAFTGMVEHDDNLLGVGNENDALYRFYDVLWDETIADFEVDEGADATFDLAAISQDASIYSLQGTPPSWLTITGAETDLVATAAPAVTADTNHDVVVRATRSGINVEETLRIVVKETGGAPALSFGAGVIANQAWVVGTAESLTLPEATGGTGTITYSLSPTLPAGVTFTSASRVLAGTPTGRFTSATFTYTATDGNSDTVELTFTIVVTAVAITFNPASFANQSWTVGTAVALTLPQGAGGVGDLTPTLTPSLPAGVTFTASTRALAGNPTAVFSVATFTYTMTDDEGESAAITFTIVVAAAAVALGFGAGTIANQAWEVGTAITSLTLPEATGGTGTITYSLSPTPPAGITFTAGTRILAGNPTGRFTLATFTYTAEDGNSDTVELAFTIIVTAIAITFASAVENQVYDIDEAITTLTLPSAMGGVGTLTYTLSPTLPAGLSRTNFDVSGTPTEQFAQTTFTWRVTDTESVSVTVQFHLRVLGALPDPHPVTVLPHSATLLEKAFVDFYVARQEDKFEVDGEIPIRLLYDPDNCPAEFLPYLQCIMSVQEAARGDFSDTQIRQLIRDSFTLHTQKGTIQSLRDVITSLGYIVNRIEEGVASMPAVPATDWARFRVVMDTALPISAGENLEGLLQGVAPVSRELVEITYDQANPYDGTIFYDGTHAYGRIVIP